LKIPHAYETIRGMSQTLYRRDLAELHNTYYSGYARNAAPGVILMLRAAGVRSGVVCDLGCGGGQLTGHLLKAGFKAVGLDVSPSMIRIARKQYPRARFTRGSIDRAALPKCAAAVAVGEVVNYLGSRGRMQRAFRNVFRSLSPGGVFLFDVKEPARHAHAPEQLPVRSGPRWALFAQIKENPRRNELVRTISSFRQRDLSYRRQNEAHRLSVYKAADVARWLRSIGFHVRIYKGYGKFALTDGRKVLLARKPQA
jgi:SAM-dependent methyltransferase